MFSSVLTRLSRNSSRPSRQFTERTRMAARRRSLFALEGLEDRTLLSGVWTGGSSANWFDPGNWDDGKVPTATTTVILDAENVSEGGFSNIELGNNATIRSLVVGDDITLDLNSFTLSVNTNSNSSVATGFMQTGGSVIGNEGGELRVGGHFTNTGGEFTANNVTFVGVRAATVTSNLTFANVTIAYAGNHVKFVGGEDGKDLKVAGDLAFTSFNTITGDIYAWGDVTSTAKVSSNATNATLHLVGSANQTLAGDGDGALPRVAIEKTANSTLTVTGSISPEGWTQTSGKLSAANSTTTFRRTVGGALVDTGTTQLGNVVVQTTSHFRVKQLNVGGNFTINSALSFTKVGGESGADYVKVAGDLNSTATSSISGGVGILMTGGQAAKIYTGANFDDGGVGFFPISGITITKGGSRINANVTQPLDGPLTINSVYYFSGSMAVGGNVTSNANNVYASNGGELVFQGGKNQVLTVAPGAHVPGVTIDKTGGNLTLAPSNRDGTNAIGVTGDWNYQGGDFVVGDSKIVFLNGTKTVNTGSLDSGMAFNDVEVRIGGGTLRAQNMVVDGDLTLTSVFYIGGVITANGDVTTAANAIASSSTNGRIDFVGGGDQTLSASSENGGVPAVVVNKPGGKLILAGPHTIDVAGNWTWTKGAVDANGSTVRFTTPTNTINTGPGNGGMKFNNVVIAISGNTLGVTNKLGVLGDLTINSAWAINAAPGAITVGGDLISNDDSVGGSADITLTSGKNTSIIGLDFPNGGININKGSNRLHAEVTQPLDGPLTINSVYYFSGSMAVGGNVTSNAVNAYASNGGALVFQGGKNQVLTVAPNAHVPGVAIDKSGGNLTLAASNHDGTNPIGVTGDWDYRGGNFVVGDSKIVFLNGSKTINTGPLGSGMAFNDVEVRIGSGNLNAQNMVVGGDLTLTSVYYVSGVITANGDVTTAANAIASSTTNGKIEFVGAGDQTLAASSEYGGVPNVVVNKPGGKLFIAGSDTIDVGGNWTWTKGTVDANGSTVRFTAPANNINTGPGNGGMKFNNVVIAIGSNTLKIENKLGVLGDLTINSAWAINAAAGAITVGGDLISNDSSVGGNADITMVGGKQTALLEGGDFPNGGIIINRGSSQSVHANVEKALNGPLKLVNLSTLSGALMVGGNVTTSDTGVAGNAAGVPVLIFTGTGNQTLSATTDYAQVPGVTINKTGGNLTLDNSRPIGITGNWEYGSGNVNVAGTTIRFAGSGKKIDSGSIAFNNVEFNSGSTNSVSIVDDMIVGGNLVITNVSSLNDGVIVARGDVTTSDASVGGSATILFSGTGDQTLSAAANYAQVPGVTIDKTGGKLILAGGNAIGVSGNWKHEAGAVNASGSKVRFAGSGKTIDSGSMTFNDVEFNSGSSSAVTIVGDMIVGGDLAITNVSSLNDGVIVARGDVTTSDASVGGSATILFTGSGKQTLKADVPNGQVPNVKINKSILGKLTLDKSNPISVSGNWDYSGLGLNVKTAGSTVRFAGAGKTIDSGLMVFNDVEFNSGSSSVVTINGAMIVGGDLTINNVNSLNGGVITALGDVTTNDASVGGSATILFTGLGKQTLKAGVPNGQVPNVSILKLGGKLTLNDSNPIGVSGNWTYHGLGRDVDATKSTIKFMGGNKEIRSGLMVFYDVDFAVGSANKVEILAPIGNSAGKLRYAGEATNTNKVTKGTLVKV